MAEKMLVMCHQYNDGVGKYSYGIGYPICTIRDEDIISCAFKGDKDEPFYEIEVSDKIVGS